MRTRALGLCGVLGSFAMGAVWACGEAPSFTTATAGADGGADATLVGPDASSPARDAAPGVDVQPPPIDAGPCDEIPDESHSEFVSPEGDAPEDAGSCPSSHPCRTIAQAQAVGAREAHGTIYIESSADFTNPKIYREQLHLARDFHYRGGFWRLPSGSWRKICTEGAASRAAGAVIEAPETENITAKAVDIGGKASIEAVTLRSRATPALEGESMYGVFVTGAGTEVELTDVAVLVSGGGAGRTGSQGADGDNDAGTGCAVPGDAGSGATGRVGAPGMNGTYSANGFAPAGSSGQGETGGIGAGGAAGGPGTTIQCYNCSVYVCDPESCLPCPPTDCPRPPIVRALAGDCCKGVPPTCSSCTASHVSTGGVGLPGCGGKGGSGGIGGTGGAASIAVFVWQARVVATGGTFQSSVGGNGGAGGPGGKGGAGRSGTLGNGETCYAGGSNCSTHTSGGAPGGVGGTGGTGGTGAQGAGGDSFAWYAGGDGGTVTAPMTALSAGGGGAGSPPGRSGDHN